MLTLGRSTSSQNQQLLHVKQTTVQFSMRAYIMAQRNNLGCLIVVFSGSCNGPVAKILIESIRCQGADFRYSSWHPTKAA